MQRLKYYAIQIAAVKNIRVKSNLNGHHSENILPAETRRNIYLLFKEAINNAVKYSNARVIEGEGKEKGGKKKKEKRRKKKRRKGKKREKKKK